MVAWFKKLFGLFTAQPLKPKPWEDPNRSARDRQDWLDSKPKSLHRGGK